MFSDYYLLCFNILILYKITINTSINYVRLLLFIIRVCLINDKLKILNILFFILYEIRTKIR